MLPRVLPPRSLQIQPRQLRRCNATEHSLPVYDQRYVPAEVQTGGAQIHFDLLRVPSTDANSGGLRSRRVALMAFACCNPARTMPPPLRSGRNPSKFGQKLLLALTLLCCTVMSRCLQLQCRTQKHSKVSSPRLCCGTGLLGDCVGSGCQTHCPNCGCS
jgi:hypothetical protein